MTTLRTSIATLAVASALLLIGARAASAQAVPTSPPGYVVPTPAPGGTPVTFKPVAAIGSPLPVAPAMPEATDVPTTSPDGDSTTFRASHEDFVIGDYLIQPKVYNELSHGEQSTQSYYALRGGAEFNLGNAPLMVEGETRRYSYAHADGLVTGAGGYRSFVPAQNELDTDIDGHLGIKLLEPRIYVAGSYLDKRKADNGNRVYGYGAGLEKLPDYGAPLGVYFSLYYYPNLTGQTDAAPVFGTPVESLRYRALTYQLGFTIAPGKSPIFIDVGALGDRMTGRGNAPSNQTTPRSLRGHRLLRVLSPRLGATLCEGSVAP